MAKKTKPLPMAKTVSKTAPAPPTKTFHETRWLCAVLGGIIGIFIARLFLYGDAEAAQFTRFLRGQSGLVFSAMLASAAFWKAFFGFILGSHGGYFLAREFPTSVRADLFSRHAAIVLLVLIIYIPAMSAGFIWDDDQEITANASLRSAQGLAEIWGGTKSADYFPLKTTMLWLEYRLWGYNSEGYHTVNIVLHGIDALLVGLVLTRLLVPGAWLAALLFAIHPVHVESVAWIAERKNTLSLLFYLLSLLAYFRFEKTERAGSYVWALLWFLAALLCKTHVVVLPFVLLLCAWWQHGFAGLHADVVRSANERGLLRATNCVVGVLGILGGIGAAIYLWWLTSQYNANHDDAYVVATNIFKDGKMPLLFWALAGICIGSGAFGLIEGAFAQRFNRHLVRSLAFFQIAVLLGVVTVWFQYGRAIGTEEIPIGHFPSRIAYAGQAVWWYLGRVIAPINLMEIYPTWPITKTPGLLDFVPDVLLLIFLGALWKFRTRIGNAPLFAVGYFVITLLPVMGFLKMSYMRLTLVADHFQYLSDIGIIALFSAGCVLLYRRLNPPLKPALIGLGAVLTIVFSAYSWERAGVHQSEETLWRDTLSKNSESWQAHNHMGAVLFTQGDRAQAMFHFSEAVRLKPINPESHNNLGLAYSVFGRTEEAIAEYKIAISIKDDPSMRMNLGNALMNQKRFTEAIEQYRAAIALDGNNPASHNVLAMALLNAGQVDEAIAEAKKALALDPNMPQARQMLNEALRRKGGR